MFESLITTGLKEFLGCPAIFHENALTEFFANGSVRYGMVVSTIGGIAVEISESFFAATFGLPTEGLTDLSEVPRNLLSDAQSLLSVSEKEWFFSSWFIREQSADVVVSISRYRFEFQRVLLRIGKRQRFYKLERRRWSAQFRISR
ncbi:hypothetical protein F511_09155 [Dorcoceras hygrometricum]|uniref:Uncharacterized protein n=1 Tax=Dorcoceras hygrometricum TaxID=472368 RepID=A0A2Z7AUV8_9LAMI|nr:hypothetical protein F511_09155 [Dorcoceras hygrometricum]